MSGTQASRLAVAWLAVALAGCRQSPDTGTGTAAAASPPPTPAAAAVSSAAPEADRAAVEAAYRRFWTVTAGMGRQPVARWRAVLSTVAVEPLLSRLYDGYQANYRAGVGEYGLVRPRPAVVGVRGGRASVVDCQDASMSGEIDTDTGLPRTVGGARTPVAATLVRGADGVWRLSDARYLDSSC